MNILKRLKQGHKNLYLTNSFANLNELRTDYFFDLEVNDPWRTLFKILNGNLKDEILYYIFQNEDVECVLLFNKPHSESDNLVIKGNHPIINIRSIPDYTRRHPSGYWSFRRPERIYLLYAIRLIKPIREYDKEENSLVFYSFNEDNIVSSLSEKPRESWRSVYFELNSYEVNSKNLLFYNLEDDTIVIKKIGIDLVGQITSEKKDELIYKINAHHNYTIGSNNWDIDTYVEGEYDFYLDTWITKNEREERFKN